MLYTLRWFAGDQKFDESPDALWATRAREAGYVAGGGIASPAHLTPAGRAELERLQALERAPQ